MSKPKKLFVSIISGCSSCPHRYYLGMEEYYCAHPKWARRRLIPMNDAAVPYPDWCPLPNA